jgi:metal-responsive CopG/Arc/MetJ family transcriptional regulator
MSTSNRRKPKASHKFNVMLTESLYQRLKDYAEAEEKDMSEVIRDLIKTLPMEKPPTIEKTPLQT